MAQAQTKAGYKSTEFWMTLAAMALTGSGIAVSPEAVGTVTEFLPVVIAGIYTIARSIVKAFAK